VYRRGDSPGSLNAPPDAHPTQIKIIDYDGERLEEHVVEKFDELQRWVESDSVSWIDVVGLADAEEIGELGELLGLSRLVLEDVLHVGQRPKAETQEGQAFVVLRLVRQGEGMEMEQVSLAFGPRFVVTFQEQPGDCFDPVRDRLREGRKRIRSLGCDYLAYALIDALIDAYFPVAEAYRERLEELEDAVMDGTAGEVTERVHALRRDLRALRRILVPTGEAVHRLLDPELDLVAEATRPYLADCYDHARRLLDTIEAASELGKDLFDIYQANLSNRMNEIMKVLTVFAAIFIPLTFVAGFYGMNFDREASPWNMPELGWVYGYPAALGLMLAMAVGLFVYFVRKGWIGGSGRRH